jgi:hypothetical protein
MNNLRIPIGILVLIVVGLIAWFVLAHRSAVPAPAAAYVAPTTFGSSTPSQTASNPLPTLNPSEVAANIVGTWQSTDDPNYSIVLTADGKWTDRYQSTGSSGPISETGTYTFFTSADPDPDFTDTPVAGVVYVKLVEGSDTYYYSVLEADGQDLQLSYLDRGNTLSFVKAQ